MSKRKSVSLLYDYFELDSKDKLKMKCVVGDCSKVLSKDYTSLKFHLQRNHSEEWKRCQEKEASKHQKVNDGKDNFKQSSIKDFVSNSVVKTLCLDLVVSSVIPFSIFDSPALKTLVQHAAAHLSENIVVNSSNMKTMVLEEASNMRKKLGGLLKNRFVNLQIDMATCQSQSFFRLNAQVFVNGEIKVMNLMCRVVEERHLAVNIQKWLKEAQDEYGISNNQLLTITIDSAANMTKAVDLFDEEEQIFGIEQENDEDTNEEDPGNSLHEEINENEDAAVTSEDQEEPEELPHGLILSATRIHCAVHKLQLGINDFLRQKPFTRVIAVAQKLTAKLRTPTARRLLKQENLKCPVRFQETRWSSTLNMLDRLLEFEEFCKRNQDLWKGLKIVENSWNIMKELSKALKPLAVLTTKLQEEKLTIPNLVTYWRFAMFQVKEIKTATSEKLHRAVELREPSFFDNVMIKIGTFLDLKCKRLLSEIEIIDIKRHLSLLHERGLEIVGTNSQTEEAVGEASSSQDLSEIDQFFGNLPSNSEQPTAMSQQGSKFIDELNAYEKLRWDPKSNKTCIEYWLSKSKELPLLSSIALDVMAIPGTEVSVERLFSHLKIVFTDKRSRLDKTLLESILLLRLNKKNS